MTQDKNVFDLIWNGITGWGQIDIGDKICALSRELCEDKTISGKELHRDSLKKLFVQNETSVCIAIFPENILLADFNKKRVAWFVYQDEGRSNLWTGLLFQYADPKKDGYINTDCTLGGLVPKLQQVCNLG